MTTERQGAFCGQGMEGRFIVAPHNGRVKLSRR